MGLACGPTGQNSFLSSTAIKKKKENTNKLRSMALGLVLHSTASLKTKHQKLEAEYSF
jgi:hypothetical protein